MCLACRRRNNCRFRREDLTFGGFSQGGINLGWGSWRISFVVTYHWFWKRRRDMATAFSHFPVVLVQFGVGDITLGVYVFPNSAFGFDFVNGAKTDEKTLLSFWDDLSGGNAKKLTPSGYEAPEKSAWAMLKKHRKKRQEQNMEKKQ
mmetsp:Transcript_99449/g.281658  ORF Transcript_99449/g.281658 Transcript_99449/m.281658 type:complete len:147 (-) Transcript_99449:77-517(-)